MNTSMNPADPHNPPADQHRLTTAERLDQLHPVADLLKHCACRPGWGCPWCRKARP